MSDYARKWDAAKKKFEADTGMKKPTDMGKVFGISYRKGTGVDSALGDIDKLMPDNVNQPVKGKTEKALRKAVAELADAADDYSQLLEKSIKAEKEQLGGKEASAIYRDLKILRATLEGLVASVKGDLARLATAREMVEKNTSQALRQTVIEIRVVLDNLDKQCKAGLLIAQGLLKNPTPDAFNGAFPKAARDITQCFAQFRKWTMPDELNRIHRANRDEQMEDSGVYDAVRDMYAVVAGFQDRILEVIAGKGTTPADADLERMANNPPRLADTASAADVTAATKHYIGEIKRALQIAEDIRRLKG